MSQKETKELEVTCPTCEKVESINVPGSIFKQKKFGTIKIQVPPGAVCKHQFICFVDPKGIIRGYEKIDLMMCRPVEVEEETEQDHLNLNTLMQMYGTYGVFSLIHAKIFDFPHVIVREEGCMDISGILNKIGDSILPEEYRGTTEVQFINPGEVDDFDNDNALLIGKQKQILQTPWQEKLSFEEDVVQKASEILDEDGQLIILQQEISKLINQAKKTAEILEGVKEEIYEDDLIEKLAKKSNMPKIDHHRLVLIKQFIRQRISEKLAGKIKNKVEEFLNLL
ncbi:MAG: hypothetical protein ACOC4M_14410 [Promethearchaeia archaeon]